MRCIKWVAAGGTAKSGQGAAAAESFRGLTLGSKTILYLEINALKSQRFYRLFNALTARNGAACK
jgi:hypothetical protein